MEENSKEQEAYMTVYFRGKPTCTCMAKWVPAFEKELRRRGLLKGNLVIYQLIGSAAASAGTHGPPGGAIDCQPLSRKALKVAREMGCGMWHRKASQGPWIAHSHGILNCPHNRNGRYQLAALAAGYNGLGYGGRGGRDDGPPPRKLRTWKQGIKWAKKQAKKKAKKGDEPMKLAWKKHSWGRKQKIGNGKYSSLRIGTTKAGNRAVSITTGKHHGTYIDFVAEFTIRGLPEGERVAVQLYRKKKNGKVVGYKSRTIDGTEYTTSTNRTIRTELRWFRKPGKNDRVRIRAQATCAGVTIENLVTYGVV